MSTNNIFNEMLLAHSDPKPNIWTALPISINDYNNTSIDNVLVVTTKILNI